MRYWYGVAGLCCRYVVGIFGLAVAAPSISAADTYTMATFSGAINGGSANVKAPFNTNGFTQGDPISGTFVFDNALVPAPGSGFTNVFFQNFPEISQISPSTGFNLTLDGLNFTLADDLVALGPAGIQYNNGSFNGFAFVTDFAFLGSEYQFRINGLAITVKALDDLGNVTGASLINAKINFGDASLTDKSPFVPGVLPSPGPIVGAGLPGVMLAASLFGWLHRRRKNSMSAMMVAAH